MSADNGIYILRTVRSRREERKGVWVTCEQHYVWRVAHAQAIENFEWYKNNEPHNLGAYMIDTWGRASAHLSYQDAVKEAERIESRYDYVKYGICNIDTELVFYGDY